MIKKWTVECNVMPTRWTGWPADNKLRLVLRSCNLWNNTIFLYRLKEKKNSTLFLLVLRLTWGGCFVLFFSDFLLFYELVITLSALCLWQFTPRSINVTRTSAKYLRKKRKVCDKKNSNKISVEEWLYWKQDKGHINKKDDVMGEKEAKNY